MKNIDSESAKIITNRYIGNAFDTEKKLNTNNNIFFPHDTHCESIILEKYERRFQRLLSDIKSKKSIFILLTRYYYIDKTTFDKIKDVLLRFNVDNKILFISGKEHYYFEDGFYDKNIIFKNIYYDVSNSDNVFTFDMKFREEITKILKEDYFRNFINP
jgi:hypothetical protein